MKAKRLFPPTDDLSTDDRYFAALIIVQAKAWAYYAVLINTEVVWTTYVSTAGTDGAYIYINPKFFLGLPNDGQRAFLLAHEVGHIVLRHPQRGRFYRKRGFHSIVDGVEVPYIPMQYNIDEDKVINADLLAHGFEFIDGPNFRAILDPSVSRDALVDEVYLDSMRKRAEEQAKAEAEQPEPDYSDGGSDEDYDFSEEDDESEADDEAGPSDSTDDEADESGSAGDSDGEDGDEADDEDGAGDASDDEADGSEGEGTADDMSDADDDAPVGSNHGADDHFEPQYETEDEAQADAWAEQDQAEIERKIDDALDQAEQMRQRGERIKPISRAFEGSGYRHGGIEASTHADWRAELADHVTRVGRDGDVDWSRPNRRRLAMLGTVVPSRKGTLDRIAVIVDISGSVSRPQLEVFTAELAGLIDLMQPASGCLVLWTDDQVVRTDECMTGQDLLDLDCPDGGCTDLSVALEWLEENGLQADITLAFTDGELYDRDMQTLADHDVLMVLDSHPDRWVANMIRNTGIHTIVASDSSLAA